MSRIYSGGSSKNRFEGVDKSVAYQPVKAQDSDRQLEGYRRRLEQDAQTKNRELGRAQVQDDLELRSMQQSERSAMNVAFSQEKNDLNAKQLHERSQQSIDHLHEKLVMGMESAHQKATAQVENARHSAIDKTIQGVLSLTKSGLAYMADEYKRQEQAQIEQDAIDATFGIVDIQDQGGIDQASENAAQVDRAQTESSVATEQAVEKVADGDERVAEELRTENRQQIAGRQAGRSNVYAAANALPTYMATFMQGDEEIVTPDGRVITPKTVRSLADLEYIQNYALAKFASQYSIAEMPREQVASVLVPAARGIRNQNLQVIGSQIVAGNKEAAVTDATDVAIAAVQAGEDAGTVFNRLAGELFSSGAFTGKGRGAANDAALKTILEVAVSTRNEQILDQLAAHQKISGQKGTELGKGRTGVLIEEARRQIRVGAVQDAGLTNRESALRTEEILSSRLRQLNDTNVTPEQEIEINRKAISDLEAVGTQESLKQAQRLKNLGAAYNPFAFGQLKEKLQRGEVVTNEELGQMVANGDITAQEAQQLGYNAKGGKSSTEVARDLVKDYKSEITGSARGIITNAIADQVGDPDARKEIADTSGRVIAGDVAERISDRLAVYIQQNPNADSSQVRAKLNELVAEMRQEVEGSLKYDAKTGQFSGYKYGGPGSAASTPITSVIPTGKNAQGRPFKNFTSYTPSDLRNLGGEHVDTATDRILTSSDLIAGAEAVQQGRSIPQSVLDRAKGLGMNPIVLMRQQAKAYGLQDDLSFEPLPQQTQNYSEGSGGAGGPNDIASGVRYFNRVKGFPIQSARILSANIAQESSWNGRRSWDIGHIDGTDRNGGLVSWQNTASSNHWRLSRIEERLGKDISQASHAEQIEAMIWEMKTYYPGAYRTFMNPQATQRQLRDASYQYWGWGHEGQRFTTYLDQARRVS